MQAKNKSWSWRVRLQREPKSWAFPCKNVASITLIQIRINLTPKKKNHLTFDNKKNNQQQKSSKADRHSLTNMQTMCAQLEQ
jgi:hypothetical protein